jgi:hypothetical protein
MYQKIKIIAIFLIISFFITSCSEQQTKLQSNINPEDIFHTFQMITTEENKIVKENTRYYPTKNTSDRKFDIKLHDVRFLPKNFKSQALKNGIITIDKDKKSQWFEILITSKLKKDLDYSIIFRTKEDSIRNMSFLIMNLVNESPVSIYSEYRDGKYTGKKTLSEVHRKHIETDIQNVFQNSNLRLRIE